MKKSFTIFFCLIAFSASASAQSESKGDYASARLFEGASKPNHTEMGLDVDLKDGWYTYWRMPGDNGLAPSFDWSESENVKDVKISWPAPKRFTTADMHSFGYENGILFPLIVTPVNHELKTTVKLKIDLVVCHDICVPQTLNVSRTIDGNPDRMDMANLRKARKALVAKENTKKLEMGAAVLGKDSVVVTATSKSGFSDKTDLIIETPHAALTMPPQVIVDDKDKTRAVLKIKAPEGFDLAKEIFGHKTTITLINGEDAVEKEFSF